MPASQAKYKLPSAFEDRMIVNIGVTDRLARFVIGVVQFAHAIAPGNWSWLGWIGVAPLATAIVGVCPLYTFPGVSTCAAKQPTSV